MIDDEIIKLRNSIAIKTAAKIVMYSLIIFFATLLIIDGGILSDPLAEYVSGVDRNLYLFCVHNKGLIIAIIFIFVFSIVSYNLIKKSIEGMIEIIDSMDKVLKDPEKDIRLSSGLRNSRE